jgi:hypothetical protein
VSTRTTRKVLKNTTEVQRRRTDSDADSSEEEPDLMDGWDPNTCSFVDSDSEDEADWNEDEVGSGSSGSGVDASPPRTRRRARA